MSADTGKPKATHIASHIEHLKDEILARWREAVRHDPEQAALIHQLDDEELLDHLPALVEKVIHFLHGEVVEGLEADAAQHGRQRRSNGYSVVPLCASCRFSAAF